MKKYWGTSLITGNNPGLLPVSGLCQLPAEVEELNRQGDNSKENAGSPLVENVDYYIEKGMYVFTKAYHLKRGYCCKSGCRHCPYGFKKSS